MTGSIARLCNLLSILMIPLFLAASPISLATSFIERPFPTSVESAPVIVRGKVGTKRADWATAPDGSKRIYTFYPIEVEEVFKGGVAKGSLQMREQGGEVGRVGMQVPGTAQFGPGEDVVVFLGERNPDGSHDIWGLMMGKFNIEKDDQGQEILSGPGLGSSGEGGIVHDDEAHEPRPNARQWSIQDLRTLVRQQAQAKGTTPQQSAPSATPGANAIQKSAATALQAQSEAQAQTAPSSAPSLKDPDASHEDASKGPRIGLVLLAGAIFALLWRWAKRR